MDLQLQTLINQGSITQAKEDCLMVELPSQLLINGLKLNCEQIFLKIYPNRILAVTSTGGELQSEQLRRANYVELVTQLKVLAERKPQKPESAKLSEEKADKSKEILS